MNMVYCPFCGTKLEDDSPWCGACGENLARFQKPARPANFKGQLESMMKDFIENNEGFLKELAEKMEKSDPASRGMFFSVEMRGEQPIVKSGDIKDLEESMKGMPLPPFVREMIQKDTGGGDHKHRLEFREVDYDVFTMEDGKDISVKMPEVSSKDGVEIKRHDDRLEIIGRGSSTIYFTEVEVENRFVVTSYDVEDGVLKITVRQAR